jgi:AraC-like DNA-binding protein
MKNEHRFPFFENLNDWHQALCTGLTASHEDLHIFRYEDVMPRLVSETPYYKDAFFHLTLATQMDAILHVNDVEYDCRTGGLLFCITPGQLIHWKRDQANWRGFVLLAKPKFIGYSLQGSQLLQDLMLFERERVHVTRVSGQEQQIMATLFEHMLNEYQQDKEMKFEVIRAYLKVLLIEAQRASKRQLEQQANTPRHEDVLYNFRQLVNQFFAHKKAVYEYAAELNITEKHLNDTVKKQTGKTASSMIKERILLEAKCLLIYTQLDVTQIAYELNFEEPSNFMRFFKTYEKITPTEFRKASALAK